MFRKKKLRIILICVVATLALCITVFAKQVTETISVMYDNIKIIIDGVEYTPKDANGNVIEPFIYDGTTYLPVRGIANAFDVDVNWDEEKQTVELGKNRFDLLSELSLYKYENTSDNCNYEIEINDNSINKSSMAFLFGTVSPNAKSDTITQTVTYKLSGKYDFLFATIEPQIDYTTAINVIIYGDNHHILYNSYYMDYSSKCTDLQVDVSGNEYMYIEVSASYYNRCVGKILLNDAMLSIK